MTASAFCFHQGAIFGGLVPPALTFFAATFMTTLLLGPETKEKEIVPDWVRA